jgi:hypothetical protein
MIERLLYEMENDLEEFDGSDDPGVREILDDLEGETDPITKAKSLLHAAWLAGNSNCEDEEE